MSRAVHYFNPGYEASVGDRLRHYTPPKMVRQLRRDLQCLPIYYAEAGEQVLVSSPLADRYRHPLFVSQLSEGDRLLPWGWAPELEGLFGEGTVPISHEEMRYLASRRRGMELWQAIYRQSPDAFLDTPPRELTADFSMEGRKWVVKSDFTSSGRGVSIVENEAELTEVVRKSHYPLYIEPYYEIVQELGLEYRYREGEATYLGFHQSVMQKGQYTGSLLAPFDMDINWYAEVVRRAIGGLSLVRYEGIIGVDTALYRWLDGSLHFVPCLEVNIRPTMGYVALCLAERYLMGRKGVFTIARRGMPILDQLTTLEPLYLYGNHLPEMGVYPLTPILDGTHFVAVLQILE